MENNDIYDKSKQADYIAILAIYMPLIWREVQEFQTQWNTHKICNQSKCSPNMVHGKT